MGEKMEESIKNILTSKKQNCKLKRILTTINNNLESSLFKTEEFWNALVAGLIANSQKQSDYLKLFLNPLNLPMGNNLDIYLEALPMPPNQNESNTNLDLAFGAIKKRENTEMGICYQENDSVNWVCFVEGKFLSDLSNKTTHNPFRNQMTRVIENLITFQDDSEKEKNSELPANAKSRPEHYIFTLLTPKIFKEENMERSRHYAMLYKEYSENKNIILDDIDHHLLKKDNEDSNKENSEAIKQNRNSKYWKYPEKKILKDIVQNHLTLSWVTYEDILKVELFKDDGELDLVNDLTDIKEIVLGKFNELIKLN